ESNSTGEIGGSEDAAGALEWVGGDGSEPGPAGSPQKGVFVKAGAWRAVYIDMANSFTKAFTGDGELVSSTGKVILDSLSLVPARNEDGTYPLVYEIFLDNFEVTEVGPPAPAEAPSVSIVRGEGDAIVLM